MLVKKLFQISVFVLLVSCHSKQTNKANSPNESATIGKTFFKYDKVDYYHILFSETQIISLIKAQSGSKNDSLKVALILADYPKSIKDTFFISQLETLGYKHGEISKEHFSLLDSIFVEKPPVEYSICTSENVYTDILIFKDHSTVVGIVKFSYGCNHHFYLLGAEANTQTFGQDGEYRKLMNFRP